MATLADLKVIISLQDNASAALQRVGDSLGKIGRGMTTYVTAPLLAIGTASIKMASDLSESISKTDVVFGSSSAAVQKWSMTTASSIGLSRNAALTAASTFGQLLENLGYTQPEAAKLSIQMTQLAADMSSFSNVPVSQTLDALRSALVGEYEPLRTLGVILSDATVKAEAMRMGLYSGTGEMTANARAAATLSLIMQQTAIQQGDVGRTAGGLANQMRFMKANLADAGATLGMVLIPYIITAAQEITKLAIAFQGLSPETQQWILIASGILLVSGPILTFLSAVITIAPAVGSAFTIMTGPVGLIVLALVGLFAAYKTNFLGFADGVNAIARTVADAFGWIVDAIKAIDFGKLAKDLGILLLALTPVGPILLLLKTNFLGLGDVLRQFGGWIAALPGQIAGFVAGMIQAGTDLLTGFNNGIQAVWSDTIVPAIQGIGPWIIDQFANAIGWLVEAGMNLLNGLNSGIQGVWSGTIVPAIQGIGPWIISQFANAIGWLVNAGINILTGLNSGIQGAWGTVVATITGVVNGILSPFAGAASWLYSAGYNVIWGFANGIRAGAGIVLDAVSSITGLIPEFIKSALGIRSPSRVMRDLLIAVPQGMAQGLLDGKGLVTGAAGALGSASIAGVNGAMAGIGGAGIGSTTHSYGGINVYVQSQPGMDERALADYTGAAIARELGLRSA